VCGGQNVFFSSVLKREAGIVPAYPQSEEFRINYLRIFSIEC
jgi:hypothetical protein